MTENDNNITSTVTVESISFNAGDVDFEPSTMLAQLKALAATEPAPELLPDHLPLTDIKTMTALFQPRGLVDNHVHDLTRLAKSGRMFDPVEVIQIGRTAYLVDGHHRREAYIQAKVSKAIPVKYFNGTVEEAVLEAGLANSKAKQPMANTERMDFAWRLVKMNTYNRKQIAESAGVSVRQIATMRDVLKTLGVDAFDHDSWWAARNAAAGKAGPDLSEDEREEWLEAQASDYARRLREEFTGKLISNPELAARALNIYFGRKLPTLLYELRQYVPDDEDPFNVEGVEEDDF